MWQPDGWDARFRIGVLTPHADVGPESELQAMAPEGVRVHAARVPFGAMAAGGAMDPTIPLAPVRAFAEPPGVDQATALLAAAPVQAIAYGFTSSAYVLGAEAEAGMVTRLERTSNGIPVVATCEAAVVALRTLGAGRLALVDPPWFDEELNELGAGYFASQGLDVVFHSPCGLSSDQRSITPADLHDWIRRNVPESAEAVFVGGNGFRAVGMIAQLEQDLGRPVLTANQVLFWRALHAAEVRIPIRGYGRIFE